MILLIAGLTASVLAVGLWLCLRRVADRRLIEKLEIAIDRHFDTLVSVRAQSLRFEACGRLYAEPWHQEIDRFLDSQLSATLGARELRRLAARRPYFARLVADRVAAGVARLPVYQ